MTDKPRWTPGPWELLGRSASKNFATIRRCRMLRRVLIIMR